MKKRTNEFYKVPNGISNEMNEQNETNTSMMNPESNLLICYPDRYLKEENKGIQNDISSQISNTVKGKV
jgi:hypothetical protein